MIDKAKLAELSSHCLRMFCDSHAKCEVNISYREVRDTIEALWKENAELTIQAERIFPIKDMADQLAKDNLKLSFRNDKLEKVAKAADTFVNGEWISPNFQKLKQALATLREGEK